MTMMVYVMGASPLGPCKVGVSDNPRSRLKGVQTDHQERLSLFYYKGIMRAREVEKASHHLLRDRHLHGEWFNVSVEEALVAINKAADNIGAHIDLTVPPHPPEYPGDLLKRLISNAKLSFEKCATMIGTTTNSVYLMTAKTPEGRQRRGITADIAIRLGKLMPVYPAEEWMKMQIAVDLYWARRDSYSYLIGRDDAAKETSKDPVP